MVKKHKKNLAFLFLINAMVINILGKKYLQNNLRHLQDTTDPNTYVLNELYNNVFNPTDVKFSPVKGDEIIIKKPEYVAAANKTESLIVLNNKVKREDYEYSGALGLGGGTIAVIAFMIIGVFICIFGISTEYPV